MSSYLGQVIEVVLLNQYACCIIFYGHPAWHLC